jgi:hypothetical protein
MMGVLNIKKIRVAINTSNCCICNTKDSSPHWLTTLLLTNYFKHCFVVLIKKAMTSSQ